MARITLRHLEHALTGAVGHTGRALIERHWGSPTASVDVPAAIRSDRRLGSRDRAILRDGIYGVVRRERTWTARLGELTPDAVWRAALVELGLPAQAAFGRPIEPVDADERPDWLSSVSAPAWTAALSGRAPLTLRAQRCARDALLQELAADGIPAEPTRWAPQGVTVHGNPNLRGHAAYRSGRFEIQDEGSQLLAELVQPPRRSLTVDLCAGAGGKSLAIADRLPKGARLVACDIRGGALQQAAKRAKRAGLRLQTVLLPHTQPPSDAARVLVDAPCTGTGTLRRDPMRRWWLSPDTLAQMRARQVHVLDHGARLVQPGGLLIYGTCSLLPAENQDQVAAFVDRHPGWERVDVRSLLGGERADDLSHGGDLVLTPDRHGTDGFYGAVLRRPR